MQCSNCRFENMPGTDACGRCGTSLRLGTATIDVHPPRARPWVKRIRRFLPWQRGYYRLRDAAEEARNRAASAVSEVPLGVGVPELPILLRLVVPGWAHHYGGERTRGRFFFWAYLPLLLLAFLFLGTGLGSVLLALAFSVHAGSVLDLVVRRSEALPEKLAQWLIVVLGLGLGLYAPAGWLLSRVASPRPIVLSTPPFEPGDIVLVNQWAYLRSAPRPGDIVFYRIPWTQAGGQGPTGRGNVVHEGERIDRVLAGPGARAEWANGQLLVNGSKSRWLPLNPERLPASLIIDVPEGHYLILPTTSPWVGPVTPAFAWSQLGVIPADNVRGAVYLRHQPLRRLWFIR